MIYQLGVPIIITSSASILFVISHPHECYTHFFKLFFLYIFLNNSNNFIYSIVFKQWKKRWRNFLVVFKRVTYNSLIRNICNKLIEKQGEHCIKKEQYHILGEMRGEEYIYKFWTYSKRNVGENMWVAASVFFWNFMCIFHSMSTIMICFWFINNFHLNWLLEKEAKQVSPWTNNWEINFVLIISSVQAI